MADVCQDYVNSLNSAFVVTVSIAVLHSVFSVIATVGNITFLVAIWRTPSLQSTSPVVLLSGLALADLGVGLVAQPAFSALHVLITTKHHDVCPLLTFYNVSTSFLSGISLATVAALSLDRYLCLYFNLRYKEIVTRKRVKATLIFIWISIAFLTGIWLKSFQAFLIAACVFLSVCTLLICFAYVKIYHLVRHHKAQIHDQLHSQPSMAEHVRTAIHTFVLVIVFSLCSAPYLCLMVNIQLTEPNRTHWLALDCAVSLLLINSSLNPFLYCWRNENIREAVKKVLRIFWRYCTEENV